MFYQMCLDPTQDPGSLYPKWGQEEVSSDGLLDA